MAGEKPPRREAQPIRSRCRWFCATFSFSFIRCTDTEVTRLYRCNLAGQSMLSGRKRRFFPVFRPRFAPKSWEVRRSQWVVATLAQSPLVGVSEADFVRGRQFKQNKSRD